MSCLKPVWARMTRRFVMLACALLALSCIAGGAQAQANYPDKPVRVILPFGPGGIADITARLIAQNFVIENMPGAGGIAAARAVLQAPTDGYTLAFFTNGTAISVAIFNDLPFDPLT